MPSATRSVTEAAPHATGYWWFGLAFTGGLSLLFNLWMVLDPPPGVSTQQVATNLVLGVIVHSAPVVLAALLSHGFNTPLLGQIERAIIILLFLTFMAMSIAHQATLLSVFLHGGWNWVMPFGIDVSAMIFLRAILRANRLNREAAEHRDIARDKRALRAELQPDIDRDIQAGIEALRPALEKDIYARARRDMEQEFILERVQRDEEIRAEEHAAALSRWNENQAQLEAEIEYRLRKELTAKKPASRRELPTGKTEKPKMTSEDKKRFVRQAMLEGDQLTREEVAELIGSSVKTVARYRKEIRDEDGWAAEAGDSSAEPQDTDETPDRTTLRAV